MNSFALVEDEIRFYERMAQIKKTSKKKQLKEVASLNGVSYKSVKKMHKKLKREMFNGK